jgi:CheY-like chemotaxis protein
MLIRDRNLCNSTSTEFIYREVQVRELTKVVLEGYGIPSLKRLTGQMLAQFTKHKDTIQLLILDVIMPSMNGIEVCTAIRIKQR